MTSVSIVGASGRMGTLAKSLVDASADLSLHSLLDSKSPLDKMNGADVVLDFTLPDVSPKVVEHAIRNNLKIVVGTSGWNQAKVAVAAKQLESHPEAAVLIIPNFSVGSMLLQRFSAQAAKFFDSIEIIEAHHVGKVDSPSGTAIRTAEIISQARENQPLVPGVGQQARGEMVAGVPVHSLRIQGISAKQDVVFGGNSEVLTISHDVSSHTAYSHGILLSINAVKSMHGLRIGLESIIED
jgi:4-hydroxy-tetrahydrodipicolinate reductase